MQKAEQVTNSMLSGRTVRKEQKITVELKRRQPAMFHNMKNNNDIQIKIA